MPIAAGYFKSTQTTYVTCNKKPASAGFLIALMCNEGIRSALDCEHATKN